MQDQPEGEDREAARQTTWCQSQGRPLPVALQPQSHTQGQPQEVGAVPQGIAQGRLQTGTLAEKSKAASRKRARTQGEDLVIEAPRQAIPQLAEQRRREAVAGTAKEQRRQRDAFGGKQRVRPLATLPAQSGQGFF